MKTLYYWSALSCLFFANEAHSYFLSHNTSLVAQIKPNPTKGSEPASYFTKLAAIYFINNDNLPKFGSGGHDIKNDPKNCPAGTTWYEGSCQKNCDKTLYPFDAKPDEKKGVSRYMLCQGELFFGYKSCHDGWLLNGGKCDVNPCTGYIYSSRPDSSKGTIAQCKSGDDMKYKYTSCKEGWDLSNGACNVHPCSSTTYPYSSNPGSEAGTVTSCKTGTSYKYGYSACNSSWDKSNGY